MLIKIPNQRLECFGPGLGPLKVYGTSGPLLCRVSRLYCKWLLGHVLRKYKRQKNLLMDEVGFLTVTQSTFLAKFHRTPKVGLWIRIDALTEIENTEIPLELP